MVSEYERLTLDSVHELDEICYYVSEGVLESLESTNLQSKVR